MRMDADGEPDGRPQRPAPAARARFRRIARREDHQRARQPGVPRPRDDGVEVGGEFLAGEMAVRVDHWTR